MGPVTLLHDPLCSLSFLYPYFFICSLPTCPPIHFPPSYPQLAPRGSYAFLSLRTLPQLREIILPTLFLGFLGDSVVKNPSTQELQKMKARSLSCEDPLKGKWQPTPIFLPGKSHDQRSLAGYSPWGRKELDTTKVTEHIPSSQCLQLSPLLKLSPRVHHFLP